MLKIQYHGNENYTNDLAALAVEQLLLLNGPVRREGNVILRPGKRLNEKLLSAIDIMYAIMPADVPSFRAVESPLLLRFAVSADDDAYFYAVLDGALLTGEDPPLLPGEYPIVLLDAGAGKPKSPLPDTTIYAVDRHDGRIVFFQADALDCEECGEVT